MQVRFVVRRTLKEIYKGDLVSDAQCVFTSSTTPVSFIDIASFDDVTIMTVCLETTPQTISRSPNGKLWVDSLQSDHQLLFNGK